MRSEENVIIPYPLHPLSPIFPSFHLKEGMRLWRAMMSFGYKDLCVSCRYSSWAQCCLREGGKGGLNQKMYTHKSYYHYGDIFQCYTKSEERGLLHAHSTSGTKKASEFKHNHRTKSQKWGLLEIKVATKVETCAPEARCSWARIWERRHSVRPSVISFPG